MISFPLLKRNMVSCVKPFLIIFAVLCMYTSVIIYMYNPEISDMLTGYQELMPEVMAAAGMSGMASTLLEWIQIYLYGFIMMLFPLIFSIILIHKLVMGYIDSGSMAGILATPNSRGKIIFTQALSAVLWTVILMAAITLVGIASAQMMFPGELDINRYLLLNASTLLLQLSVTGIAFLSACLFSESKNYYATGAGIPILFFLIQMVSNMGDKLENLRYVTIYTLLPAADIVQGKSGYWKENLVLGMIAAALFGGSIWWFKRRDLSL